MVVLVTTTVVAITAVAKGVIDYVMEIFPFGSKHFCSSTNRK